MNILGRELKHKGELFNQNVWMYRKTPDARVHTVLGKGSTIYPPISGQSVRRLLVCPSLSEAYQKYVF